MTEAEARDFLAGGVVQRVWASRVQTRDVLLLRVRVPTKTSSMLIRAARAGARVAVVRDDGAVRAVMRGEAKHPRELQLRGKLEGARIVRVASDGLVLERDGERWAICSPGAGAIVLVDAGDVSLSEEIVDRAELERLGDALAEELASSSGDARRRALARELGKAKQRLERRAAAVRGDLARIETAQTAAHGAQIFVAEAAKAPRGATELRAIDWSAPEPIEATMKLDPSKSAREQVDAIFRRAKRMKEGARIGKQRLAATEEALAAIGALERELEAAANADPSSLDAIALRARRAAGKDFALGAASPAATPRSKREQAPSPPYRTFRSSSGAKILVGRGAAQNDELTLHVAKPIDLWLHAKNRTGAHVIVPLPKNASCPADVLVDAAHLAAHFSDARDEAVVEIQHTPKRYLRKPKGSAPGFVIVDREKVLVLRKEEGRVERLLASEET